MKIRRVDKSDMMFLFNLRNDPVVRASAFSSEAVDLEVHTRWFNQRIDDPNTVIFIAEENGQKIGQVRFDIDSSLKVAEVDVGVIGEFRGRGFGSAIIKECCNQIFNEIGIREILAHIKINNDASIHGFSKAGFINCGEVKYKNQQCMEMKLVNPLK